MTKQQKIQEYNKTNVGYNITNNNNLTIRGTHENIYNWV